ncbi:Mannose-6-phosphate isomerase [Vibrio aerogenes CECT 7868]|uniref:mannose-6-phosphate isomerase n=2 Tax=Vibrio aerogenes TaxID=92172 RepID=A0A1M5W4R4_9VIBR|nr:mannose-6-phosphate isomerase, class I [Vibrio aerogenes]SHH82465.1 Mannose-6-phosphate isomerase [Vibrio aerogenes CECT 7868]
MINQSGTRYFFPMKNVIQNYAWGSRHSIQEMFDIPNPELQPQAEVWMGAHPNGCSEIIENGEQQLLSDFIQLDRSGILGVSTDIQFGELPFLFKILAAEQALSVQVHPDKSQAENGFAKEEAAGIPRTAAHRNYKDPNHKPELVFALTPYQAMNGFREFDTIVALFKTVNVTSIQPLVTDFEHDLSEHGLRKFFQALLSLEGEQKASAVDELLSCAGKLQDNQLFSLIFSLGQQYPGDIGVFCPLMLNVLTLKPGEAMFLDASTPHAYIHGTALEVMANSDNVLRSGLTPKHMDVRELVKCTRFRPVSADNLLTQPEFDGQGMVFPVPVDDFRFSLYDSPEAIHLITESAEILLALDNTMTLSHVAGESIQIEKGHSVFIPAFTGQYRLTSAGRVARVRN